MAADWSMGQKPATPHLRPTRDHRHLRPRVQGALKAGLPATGAVRALHDHLPHPGRAGGYVKTIIIDAKGLKHPSVAALRV